MISMVVATGRNGVIGLNNKMPWHMPADLAYFKRLTTGHTVVMGRKTFQSIGKPLVNRKNIILTKDRLYQTDGCSALHAIDEVLELSEKEEVFIIGGAEIYRQFLPYSKKIYLTYIDEEFAGDTFFPEIGEGWQLISQEKHCSDERNPYNYEFRQYDRQD